MRRVSCSGLCLGIIIFGAGCAPRPAAPPPPSHSSLTISLQFTPARPRQLDPTGFQVQVRDAAGLPVTDAQVRADLTMPAMDMGKNEAVLKPQGAGAYTGTARFTMPGDWQVTVTVKNGGETAQQYFPVSVS